MRLLERFKRQTSQTQNDSSGSGTASGSKLRLIGLFVVLALALAWHFEAQLKQLWSSYRDKPAEANHAPPNTQPEPATPTFASPEQDVETVPTLAGREPELPVFNSDLLGRQLAFGRLEGHFNGSAGRLTISGETVDDLIDLPLNLRWETELSLLQQQVDQHRKVAPAPSATPASKPERVETATSSSSQPRQSESRDRTAPAFIKTVNPQQRSTQLLQQAVQQLKRGQQNEAAERLDQVLQLDASQRDARQMLIRIRLLQQNYEAADQLLQQGIEQQPDYPVYRTTLARLRLEQGNTADAIEILQQGLTLSEQDADYHAFLAALLQRSGQHHEAASHFLQALQSQPAHAKWLVGIGTSWMKTGQIQEARAAFVRARQTGRLSQRLLQYVNQQLEYGAQQQIQQQ